MERRVVWCGVSVVVVWAGASIALAGEGAGRSVSYELGRGADFTQDCEPVPCECALFVVTPLLGSLTLTPVTLTGVLDTYAVEDIQWSSEVFGSDVLITGSGTYTIFKELVVTQQLELELVVGTSPPLPFDSGVQLGGGSFPAIDIDIALTEIYCPHFSMTLRAAPADACPDLDGSGDVGFGELLAVISAWGPCPRGCPEDLDGSGAVDFTDLLVVLTAWGPCA